MIAVAAFVAVIADVQDLMALFDPHGREVRDFIDAAAPAAIVPKALIVPHAGYMYSGAVAGRALPSGPGTCRPPWRAGGTR